MDSPEPHNILFVYDALMRGQERQNFLSRHKARFLQTGTTAGLLCTIGDMPGLVITASSPQQSPAENHVAGELFEIFDPATFFATLDVIAGYWPEQQERSLFVRRLIPVQTAAGSVEAWAYLLNLPINGLPRLMPSPATERADAE